MIAEMYELDDCMVVTLTPENQVEEDILRAMKILHKNRLMVWWGDTLELEHRGKFLAYEGLKIALNKKDGDDDTEKRDKILELLDKTLGNKGFIIGDTLLVTEEEYEKLKKEPLFKPIYGDIAGNIGGLTAVKVEKIP